MMDFKKIYEKLQSQGIPLLGVGVLAGFVILLIFFRLIERPIKSVCEYILKEERQQMLGQEDKILPVEACIAEVKPMTKRIETTGNLKANNSVVVKSEMSGGQGKIKKIHFEQGTCVKKGDLLLEFEDADFKARLSSAKAELEMAELDFGRVEPLFKQKIESQKKYDESKAKLSVAKAKVEEAEANLAKTKIFAPFDGTAGIISFSEGATVQNNQDLFKIVDETPMRVEFAVPERNVHDIGVGQTIEIKVDAFKDKAFKGVVQVVDSAINADTHSLSVVGSVPNPTGELRQGLFCNVSVVTGEQGDTLQVDETAIQLIQEKEVVFVVDKGRAIPAPVIRGYSENGKVEIKAGLRPGMIVITAGQVKFGGEKVKITNLSDDILSLSVDKKKDTSESKDKPKDQAVSTDKKDPKVEETVAIDATKEEKKEEPKTEEKKPEPETKKDEAPTKQEEKKEPVKDKE